jgi:small conductance mechanosensitive channel
MTDPPQDESPPAGRGRHWRELGLARQIPARVARRARVKAILLAAVLIGVILVFESRYRLLGEQQTDSRSTLRVWDSLVRAPVAIAVVVLGWALARDVGQALGPALRRHMDAAAAGTVGFLIRLVTVATTVIVAAGFAGVDLRALVVGGAFTAVVVGLAAQQTLGNLIAGTVLLTARPFRVGERVRLQGSPGRVEGVVSSLGLLYTTLADGDDNVMVPNSVVLGCAVAALREPAAVNLRARVPAGLTPADLEQLIESALTTPIRARPRVTVVELDGDEVVVELSATPQSGTDGAKLAAELLDVVSRETGSGGEAPGDGVPDGADPAARRG